MPPSLKSKAAKGGGGYSTGDVAEQLQSMWNRAEKERKTFMQQVLPKVDLSVGTSSNRRGLSPKVNLLTETLSAKLGDLHQTVSKIKDGPPQQVSDLGLWTLDSDGMPLSDEAYAGARGSPPSLSDSDSTASTVDASSKMNGRERERMRTLEAMVIAHQDEIRELRGLVQERDGAVQKLQSRNGALTARLEEREQHIARVEGKMERLHSRLREADAYGPPAWIVKEAVKGGYGLEAMGLMDRSPTAPQGQAGTAGGSKWHDDDMWGGQPASLVPGYDDFIDRLTSPSAAPLLNMVESFSKALLQKKPRGSDAQMVVNFFGAMEHPFRSHALWSGADEQVLEDTMDGLERKILGEERIAESIIANIGGGLREMDEELARRMWCLGRFVKPEHLDIKRAHSSHPALTLARKMLCRVNTVHAPQEKLECVFRCSRIIFRMLNETAAVARKEAASADDFLPLLILTALRCGAQGLHSTIEYICSFRRASRMVGERHYYLVQLQTAITFIHHIDASSLTIGKDDFRRELKSAEEAWEAERAGGGGEQLGPPIEGAATAEQGGEGALGIPVGRGRKEEDKGKGGGANAEADAELVSV